MTAGWTPPSPVTPAQGRIQNFPRLERRAVVDAGLRRHDGGGAGGRKAGASSPRRCLHYQRFTPEAITATIGSASPSASRHVAAFASMSATMARKACGD